MTVFETTHCNRCGGGGHYSRNAYGSTTCYACKGSGKKLTKRGAAAQRHFHDSLRVPANTVQPGWLVWWADIALTGKWVTVADVQIRPASGPVTESIDFTTAGGKRAGLSPSNHPIRAVESMAYRDRMVQAALAFQATLGGNGKPTRTQEAA